MPMDPMMGGGGAMPPMGGGGAMPPMGGAPGIPGLDMAPMAGGGTRMGAQEPMVPLSTLWQIIGEILASSAGAEGADAMLGGGLPGDMMPPGAAGAAGDPLMGGQLPADMLPPGGPMGGGRGF